MTPAAALMIRRRSAVIAAIDASGTPGQVLLRDAGGATIVAIVLATPCGVVDATGVALAATEYAQIAATGVISDARLVSGDGTELGEIITGLATDTPAPEIQLPSIQLYAGAFIRLSAAHIDCG